MTANRYILTTDNDSHWFVIPADRNDEWVEYCKACNTYWTGVLLLKEPPQPQWADAVGGAPSRVAFSSYEIK